MHGPRHHRLTEPDQEGATMSDQFTIQGVEIFKAGTWNGDTYTEADLDAIASAAKAAGYGIPLKLGHKEVAGEPAAGWVENLVRRGQSLFADLVALPKQI